MLANVASFLRFFETVHARTVRDVGALPANSQAWKPPASATGEAAWGIGEVVDHICQARAYFVGAFCGRGWRFPESTGVVAIDRATWVPALQASFAAVQGHLIAAEDAWLSRRVTTTTGEGQLAGWRVLMLMVEHEIHHRSQIDTYAGLQGWPVPDLFNLSYEQLAELDRQVATTQGHA